jgi:hypothetical protein
MALFSQGTAKEVSTRTCLHPDQRDLYVGCEGNELLLRELLPQQHLPSCAQGYNVKGGLAKIDTNRTNLHVDSPSMNLHTILYDSSKIKRRTISLTGFQ